MRIVQITPGTGNFFCGSCLRDNTLVTALRARGHDVVMVPLYLPIVTDETAAWQDAPIFFGGLNVYLEQKLALFRHTPPWLDRLFAAPALLRVSARFADMTTAAEHGELAISMLRGEAGHQAKELAKLLAWLEPQPQPDVICLSNTLLAGLARRLKQALRAPVIATLQGEDLFLDQLPSPWRERAWDTLRSRCADLDGFVAVSAFFSERMRERLHLPAERVRVVHNGIALDGFACAPAPPHPPVLGYLARLQAGKGLGTLVDAFLEMKKRDRVKGLRLRVAGAKIRADEPFIRQQQRKLQAAGVADRVDWLPNLSREQKQTFLRSLSVFSVPATYGEAFGLYVIEAIASGVPVVQPRHAAFPELLEETGGGILCEPDDPAALADAVEKLLLDPGTTRALGTRGRAAVQEKFSVERMAENVENVLKQVALKGTLR